MMHDDCTRAHARCLLEAKIAGPIGMVASIFAKLRGAQVTVLDGRADRLEVCSKALHADHTVLLDTSEAATDAKALAQVTGDEFFDVVFTQRSIRQFKPDPIPDEALWKILDDAIRAPSGSKTQP